MYFLPEIMANSQKDLKEVISAIIANGYVENFQQNVQELRDWMDCTVLYKTNCFLGNPLPNLRNTLTEKKSLNMSM